MNAPSSGQRLRAARLARGLTQSHLAALVGVHQSTLSLLERGVTGAPGLATLVALARALDVAPAWLTHIDPDATGGP